MATVKSRKRSILIEEEIDDDEIGCKKYTKAMRTHIIDDDSNEDEVSRPSNLLDLNHGFSSESDGGNDEIVESSTLM